MTANCGETHKKYRSFRGAFAMEYNNSYNKPYCGISQPIPPAPGSSGFFTGGDNAPTFLKIPNPPYIKQEVVTVGQESVIHAGTVTPPVNYSQNQHYVPGGSYAEPDDPEKPLFYRKPFDMPYMPNHHYMQPHVQQFPQHPLPHPSPHPNPHPHHYQLHHSQQISHVHQHQQHTQQQQQPQQQQQLPPPPLTVPSDIHSPQQQLGPDHLHRPQQQQHHQQHHPSSFHEYFDHLDPSSMEPYAYVLQKPLPPAPPIHPSEAASPMPSPFPIATVSTVPPPASTTPSTFHEAGEQADEKMRFKCESCPKSFDTRAKLEKHNRTHRPNGSEGGRPPEFKCRMCDKTFRTKSTLICHEKVHGENGLDNQFSCVECGKVFATAEKLQVHRRLHTGEKPYQCKVCQKRFNHQSNLIVHSRIHEKVKQALKCARCSKVLDSEERLAVHMRLHTGEKPYKCAYCEKRFNHKSTVSTHEKATHIAANSYKCERCHKTFNQKCQLQYHEKLQEEHTIACDLCEKVFCYRASHKEHMFKVHFPRPKKEHRKRAVGGLQAERAEPSTSGPPPGVNGNQGRNKFKCAVCDRRFYYKRALEMHMGVHDSSLDMNVLYFSCNYCPETFTEEESLQEHEAQHVAAGTTDFLQNMKTFKQSEKGDSAKEEDVGFRCPLCFKPFDDQQTLREHHKTHLCPLPTCDRCEPARGDAFDPSARSTYDAAEDMRPTVCNICHRELPTFEAYQNHFHYHTSRVPFYCYHCREEFTDKRELYNHTRRKHAPREPESYTCEVCAKVFSTKGNFKRHLKSHETVRAFACDRCSKQYDYKSALEVHLKRSHGIEL